MKLTRIGILWTLAATWLIAQADEWQSYYAGIEGKSGKELRQAIKKAAMPDDFVSIVYGEGHTSFKTWQAFEQTDVRMVGGKAAWWDMYSNRLVYVESGHSSLNIEHSVANSWWGGQEGSLYAYQDLFHLNPSNSEANNAKSNNPIGVVGATASFDNGLTRIGVPAAGYGGGAGKVFEPADEYKGDFARAYFYIFTTYNDIPWRTDKGGEALYTITADGIDLQPWAAEMLLRWAEEDPVDDKEVKRNELICGFQHNRNPFIDFPELARYIYGDKQTEAFFPSTSVQTVCNRPAEPVAREARLANVNTYTLDYWGAKRLAFDVPEGDLWISIDGGDYERYGSEIELPEGKTHGQSHVLKAYSLFDSGEKSLRSPIVTVTATSKDPDIVDYTAALWTATKPGAKIDTSKYYIVVSADNGEVMGCVNGGNYLKDSGLAGFVNSDDKNQIDVIPQEAGIVRFVSAGDAGYTLQIKDAHGESKGYWVCSGKNKMKYDATQGTTAQVSIDEDGNALIQFAQNGSLQYNKTSPRFVNYESAQGKIKLYEFMGFIAASAAVAPEADMEAPVGVTGNTIIAPAGSQIFDLGGRRVSGENLQRGIYMVRTPAGKGIKVMISE